MGGIIFPFGNFFSFFLGHAFSCFGLSQKRPFPLWIIGIYFACMHPESSMAYKFYEGLIRVSSNILLKKPVYSTSVDVSGIVGQVSNWSSGGNDEKKNGEESHIIFTERRYLMILNFSCNYQTLGSHRCNRTGCPGHTG